jgi:hypothetical protein
VFLPVNYDLLLQIAIYHWLAHLLQHTIVILVWHYISAEWKCWSVQRKMTTTSKRYSGASSLCPGSYLLVVMTVPVDWSDVPVHMSVQAARTRQVDVLEALHWSLQAAVWPRVQKEQQGDWKWPALSQEVGVLFAVRAVKPNNRCETLMMIAVFHRATGHFGQIIFDHGAVTYLDWWHHQLACNFKNESFLYGAERTAFYHSSLLNNYRAVIIKKSSYMGI